MFTRRVTRYVPLFALVALFAVAPLSAQPQSDFVLSAGWFPTSFNSSARLSAEDIVGTDVDLENDLGLDTRAQNFRIEGLWRFRPKHSLEFGYTSWRRTAEHEIDRDIEWGENHFDAGAEIRAVNNAQFIKIAYHYSFIRTDRTELAATAGVDMVWNKTSLEGEGTITGSGGQEVSGFISEDYNYIAPAPVFGLSYGYMVRPDTLLRASAEYFQATFEDTTGKILDVRGSADYYFSPRYGAGLGYNWVGYKVERERFDGTYDFSGPILYFSYRR